jgi:flagellar basal-body rod modification protein FlgD
MMSYDISSIVSSINESSSTTATETETDDESSNTLGQEAFLELLVAQLQNQDPLDPMDNTEYVSQLAQFSSLEQMQSLNDTMSQYLSYDAIYSSSSLIGETIELSDGTTGEVEKLAFEDGETYLYVAGQEYSIDDVANVYTETDSETEA